jgi:signal transduction histidine kinase
MDPAGPSPATGPARLAARLDLRRPWRDWLGDLGVTGGAAVLGLLMLQTTVSEGAAGPDVSVPRDLSIGAASWVVMLLLRRRHPVGVAVLMVFAQLTASTVLGTAAVAVFSVAMLRPWRTTAVVALANLGVIVAEFRVGTASEEDFQEGVLVFGLLYLVLVTSGLLVRSRRQLIDSLRERARAAEEGQRLRVEEARLLERERIAREMHDVLAHRISLLAVHAGALEFRPDAPADQRAAAGVIRQSAYEAMEDLREVIGVLRDDSGGAEADRPQPALTDVPGLVREASAAAGEVVLDDRVPDPARIPVRIGRHAYRIVQEGLTNARKHAPGARVRVTLDAPGGTALTIEIVNPIPPGPPPAALPGAGAGLVGLGERVALLGGTLEHGRTGDGRFRLHARLPLPG